MISNIINIAKFNRSNGGKKRPTPFRLKFAKKNSEAFRLRLEAEKQAKAARRESSMCTDIQSNVPGQEEEMSST
jgi:hypothetical protein